MTNDKTKEISTQEQQHLRGGQESLDMELLREQWRKDGVMRDLIAAVGALSSQQFFTVQGISELCELQSTLTNAINTLIVELRRISDGTIQQADDIHSVIHDDASVKVNTGLDDLLSDTLYDSSGEGIGGNIEALRTDLCCACDPAADTRLKIDVSGGVNIGGELATYPQPY